MYTVDENGNKKKIEQFRGPPESAQAPVREHFKENYTHNKKKCPMWLYWVLGGVALAIILLLIWWLTKSGRSESKTTETFGFRFY